MVTGRGATGANQAEGVDLEIQTDAHPTQQVNVALALTPEVEVLTHNDRSSAESLHKHLGHEGLSVLSGASRVEGHHLSEVHTRGG